MELKVKMWWIDKVLRFYPFGSLLKVIEGGGTANLNLVVETEKGKFFLKMSSTTVCFPGEDYF